MATKSQTVLGIQEYENEQTAFSLPSDVWDHYLKYRPSYPDSMWNKWLDYHRGDIHTAHELGTGCGIGAAKLMNAAKARGQPIRQMILSDPADSNLKTAERMLQHRNQFPDAAFRFYRKRGEDSFLKPGSVDMVIACECLHWMDIRKAAASIHASLRPGGTFAAVHYSVPSMRIIDNERATDALRRLLVLQGSKQSTVMAFSNRLAELSKLGPGLNFVPLDKDLWEDVTRTWINIPEGQTSLPSWGVRTESSSAPSMTDAKTETFQWAQDVDGWGMKNCTLDRVKGMLATTYFCDEEMFEGDAWKDFENTVGKSGDSFPVAFFATTFLSRKRA
ncbi:hypothetical protein N0V93_000507 [Gnomoniopsis smithogilvyi]|uniref:Methyltransferase type 11 domain-containing protein n=1 Tax=Gnomoniopsis smithogilvyi TaxID=1191159 RepID=A0A9W9D0S3_9PEZI|nr:hypothetical protein N0V93_000507 [Gnomoniopsis smithogilvyi]